MYLLYVYQVFIMLYTEDFIMRHYVGFSQIRSQVTGANYNIRGIFGEK